MTILVLAAVLSVSALAARSVWRRRASASGPGSALRALAVSIQQQLPLPSAESIAVRCVDKIATRSITTSRTKFIPTHVNLALNPAMFDRIAPIWPKFSQELVNDVASRAAAESWEYSGIAFSLKANPRLGRRDLDVHLRYPEGDDSLTDQIVDRPGPRGAEDFTDAALRFAGSRWFADLPDGKRVALRAGQRVLVGASSACDALIASKTVSRTHVALRLHPSAQVVDVEDLNSTNGTWIDRRRLQPGQPIAVTRDCVIRLGSHDQIRLVSKPSRRG